MRVGIGPKTGKSVRRRLHIYTSFSLHHDPLFSTRVSTYRASDLTMLGNLRCLIIQAAQCLITVLAASCCFVLRISADGTFQIDNSSTICYSNGGSEKCFLMLQPTLRDAIWTTDYLMTLGSSAV